MDRLSRCQIQFPRAGFIMLAMLPPHLLHKAHPQAYQYHQHLQQEPSKAMITAMTGYHRVLTAGEDRMTEHTIVILALP